MKPRSISPVTRGPRAWLIAVAMLAGVEAARADVIPPPQPLKCGPGQCVETSHSGVRCANRPCVSTCAKVDAPAPAPRCPRKAALNWKRSDALLARLRSHETGKNLVASLGRELTICYGDVREGVLQSDGVLVLQRDRTAQANAARLGHLIFHLVEGLPFDEASARQGKSSCQELVKRAGEMEKLAHGFENELRKAFGLDPLAFEDLSGQYETRCQALRPK